MTYVTFYYVREIIYRRVSDVTERSYDVIDRSVSLSQTFVWFDTRTHVFPKLLAVFNPHSLGTRTRCRGVSTLRGYCHND